MYSVDFDVFAKLQGEADWPQMEKLMVDVAQKLERAGADFIVICSNTMHKVAPAIQKGVDIPLLHIADATAKAIKVQNVSKVGLLGTKFTMEQAFLKEKLENHHLEIIIPDAEDRETIHQVIYEELVKGIISDKSRAAYLKIMDDLTSKGAQGIILGCTEIGLLVNKDHTSALLFDTTEIHAVSAVEMALGI